MKGARSRPRARACKALNCVANWLGGGGGGGVYRWAGALRPVTWRRPVARQSLGSAKNCSTEVEGAPVSLPAVMQ